MAKRRNREHLLTDSPFFANKEVNTKAKFTPIDYNKEEDYYITKRVIFKSEEYTKAIIEKDINITKYYELSNLAKTLLYYIITTRLEYNSLTFHLDVEIFARILKYKSTKKIYTAIKELIEQKYIAKTTTKQLYWINHNKYYKGNILIIKTVESNET